MSPTASSPSDSPALRADGEGSWSSVVEAIGPKVRVLRQERGLSLQQLAHVAGVSAAAVHKVERGDMVPTITTLLKLAGALRTPIRHFLDAGSPEEPLATHTRWVDTDPTTPGTISITGSAKRPRSAGAVIRIAAGEHHTGRPRPEGEVLLVVLHGHLDVTVADESYQVAAGESLHFPTHVDHTWSNPGPSLAQAICFETPPAG